MGAVEALRGAPEHLGVDGERSWRQRPYPSRMADLPTLVGEEWLRDEDPPGCAIHLALTYRGDYPP